MIVLNGRRCELEPGAPVTAALRSLGLQPDARGVAVAVDGEVVPRAGWETFVLPDAARVEVLTAMQGG
jgi:sulfur carrier protein